VSKGVAPRLLIINQYYWPGVEATANLLTDLAEDLAPDFDVTVVTGQLHDYEDLPARDERNGVKIFRVPSLAFERSRISRRALNYVTFLGIALARGLSNRRPDLVVCMTDPPIVGDVALLVARRFRVPLLVISEDVFPEIAVELKRLENRFLVGTLRELVGFYLMRGDPELGRHARADAAGSRQRLGTRAWSRGQVCRHALGKRWACTEPGDARACRDLPTRSRRR
jgi:hypothetical protein